MPEIPLRNRQGEIVAYTQVDPLDFAHLAGVRWHLHQSDTKRYAAHKGRVGSVPRTVFLHRVILGLHGIGDLFVDHVNNDGLDNRRENLRVVSTAQNAQNQASRGGSSRHRGVSWDRSRGKWIATVMVDGRRRTVGRFDDEELAGQAASSYRRENMPFSAEAFS